MKSTTIRSLLGAAVALFVHSLAPAHAIPIGPGAFGPGAIFESFEGITAGTNSPASFFGGQYLAIGAVAPYTFASGARMTAPIPNANDPTVVLVGDFALGGASWGLIGNGDISSSSDVPFGTAYLGNAFHEGPIEFTFPSELSRVGIYATSVDGESIIMAAYSTAGVLLDTVNLPAVHEDNWGTNFLGIQSTGGIRRITLTATAAGSTDNVPVFDGLTFEVVPEPTTGSLLVLGLGSVLVHGHRSGRQRRHCG